MGYKMKQDKSPVTNAAPPFNNYESLGLSTSGAGQGYVDPTQQSPVDGAAGAAGAGGGGFNATGAGAIAGVAGGLVNEFGESDATKGGYVGTQATSKALEYAGMGAALGPYGMAAGALIGGTMGVINAKKEAKEAKKQAKIAERTKGKGEAMGVLAQNQLALGITKKGKIKMKPIKKLGAVTGTISPNMSMAQYKDENKFSAIAKNMDEPIMNLGFIKAKTLEKDPNATTMVVDGEKMPIKKLKY